MGDKFNISEITSDNEVAGCAGFSGDFSTSILSVSFSSSSLSSSICSFMFKCCVVAAIIACTFGSGMGSSGGRGAVLPMSTTTKSAKACD